MALSLVALAGDRYAKKTHQGRTTTEQQELEQCHQAQQNHGSLAISDDLLLQINQLSEIDKQAIYLFYLEEMTLQEISAVLGVPIGTVKSRLNRARNQLRKTLTNNCH